jgi:hypothetical protein
MARLEIARASVHPPGEGAVRHESGKGGVSKIELVVNAWLGFPEGLRVIFADGSATVYRGMPYSVDMREKGRPA